MSRKRSSLLRSISMSLLAGLLILLLAACGSTTATSGTTATPATTTTVVTPSPTVPPKMLPAAFLTYKGHNAGVISVAWSPDGKRIVSGSDDGTVQLWDAAAGKRIWSYTYPGGAASYVFAVAWSPDGKRIAAGGQQGAAVILDAATGHPLTAYYSYSTSIQSVPWSPDGKFLAFGTQGDNSVRVINTTTGKQVVDYTGQTDSVNRLAWSPDGKEIASASHDGTVQVWDALTGKKLLTYTVGVPVWSVAWSPDGKRIVCGTGAAGTDHPVSSGNTVKVFDAATGQTLLTYSGHSGQVYALAWSPDGKYIASGGDDKTVRIWNAQTGQTLLVGQGFSDIVWSVAWSPDGKELAASSQDSTAHVWHISL